MAARRGRGGRGAPAGAGGSSAQDSGGGRWCARRRGAQAGGAGGAPLVPRRGGRGRRRRSAEPAAGAGGGAVDAAGPAAVATGSVPLPLAGNTFARGGGWTSPYVPMGRASSIIFRYATVLRDIGFNGPMELEAEYPLGGAESGADKITLPRAQVIGSLKRDVLTIRAAFGAVGNGPDDLIPSD